MICIPVILAGGFGKRLAPLSTIEEPKQFIKFFKNKTSFFQHTIQRLRKVFNNEKIIIVCNIIHINLVKQQLRNINENNYILIVEEENKNTFCSLLLTMKFIKQQYKYIDTLFISTTDSFIEKQNLFVKNLKISLIASFFTKKNIIFGIKPTEANTQYGYINIKKEKSFNIFDDGKFFNVNKFIEKPNKNKAIKLVENENYLWNSGNFIFNFNTLMKEVQDCQKQSFDIYKIIKLKKINQKIFINDKNFLKLENSQIDKSIIEKSKNLICCKADFDWCDIGSFDVILKLINSNKISLPYFQDLCFNFNKHLLKNKSTL